MELLIGGHLGSGKSVFRKVSNSHPNIELTDDFGTFFKIDVSYRQHLKGLKLKWSYPSSNYYPLSRMSIVCYLAMILLRSLRNGKVGALDVEMVLKRIFSHASVVGDTFNRYASNLDQTLNVPCLKHVVIYRDCRDIAALMRRRLQMRLDVLGARFYLSRDYNWIIHNLDTHDKVVRHWLKYIRMMEKHRDSVYMIRYEDLVADPQAVLTPFGHWLGVDPYKFKYDFIHTNDVGYYKQVLSEQEVADILAVAGPTMERLGFI